jgi:hypothetical protein
MSFNDKNWAANTTTTDGELASYNTVTDIPLDESYIEVKVNGVEYEVGNGVKTKVCYFSGDNGATARGFSSSHPNGKVQIGDKLFWNGSIAGVYLAAGWRISLNYLK